jgi:hypothetical protein
MMTCIIPDGFRPDLLARMELRQLMIDGLRLSSDQIDRPGPMM